MTEHRIALVTGGTGGIGTAICKALSQQGHKVVAGYFPPEKDLAEAWLQKQTAAGLNVAIVGCDVSDFEASKAMVESVEADHGDIGILVNCAGITRDKTLKRMTLDQWSSVIRTNLDSAFNVTHHVVTKMSDNGYGRIVNISSVNGQKGQVGQANYSAAKAGLHGFTKAVALELAAKGVTVNTVSPGYVETEMTAAIPAEILESIVSTVPMGRMATPDEIAFAVAYLTDDRNGYMTGANLPVNGGLYMS